MDYSLAQKFNGALPAPLLERYRSADGAALRAALFAIERGGVGAAELINELGFSREVAQRAVAFWVDAGLLCRGEPAPVQKSREGMTPQRMAREALVNPELGALFCEAQRILGRPTSHAENMAVASAYLDDQLPAELILFVLEYSRPLAEPGFEVRYAEKVARSWKKAGIITLPAAEEHVAELAKLCRQEQAIAAELGVDRMAFTARERRMIGDWFQKYGYNEEFAAEAVRQSGKTDVAYINSVMRSWHEKGCRTLRDTREGIVNAPASGRKIKGKDTLFEDVLDSYAVSK